MTVQQLLASLDSAELTEWRAYFDLENERSEPPTDESEVYKKAFNVNG